MRLNWLQRVGLLVLGASALGGAVALSIIGVGAAEVIGLTLPGFLILTFAIIGHFPNVNLKEGEISWPEIKDAVDDVARKSIAALNEDLEKELSRVSTRLENYILANEPPPKDEDADHELTDQERLDNMFEAYRSLDEDVSQHEFTGEDYDDGISLTELRKWRDDARTAYHREVRRQNSQYEFGMREKPARARLDD